MRILITGARSGIGYETGLRLSKDNEVILSVHTDNQLITLKEKIKKMENNNLSCIKLDITNEFDRLKIRDMEIDCLINNASIGIGGSLLDTSINDIKKNFEINVLSSLRLSQIYAANLYVNKKKGKIIFLSSLAGIIPISFLGSYCITKTSLIMVASILKKELRLITNDIKVKLIEPGIYNTGFNDVMIENKLNKNSLYFKNLESITLKQKKLFKLVGKDNLDSITKQIEKSIKDNSNKLIYRAPISQIMFAKLYSLIFK